MLLCAFDNHRDFIFSAESLASIPAGIIMINEQIIEVKTYIKFTGTIDQVLLDHLGTEAENGFRCLQANGEATPNGYGHNDYEETELSLLNVSSQVILSDMPTIDLPENKDMVCKAFFLEVDKQLLGLAEELTREGTDLCSDESFEWFDKLEPPCPPTVTREFLPKKYFHSADAGIFSETLVKQPTFDLFTAANHASLDAYREFCSDRFDDMLKAGSFSSVE